MSRDFLSQPNWKQQSAFILLMLFGLLCSYIFIFIDMQKSTVEQKALYQEISHNIVLLENRLAQDAVNLPPTYQQPSEQALAKLFMHHNLKLQSFKFKQIQTQDKNSGGDHLHIELIGDYASFINFLTFCMQEQINVDIQHLAMSKSNDQRLLFALTILSNLSKPAHDKKELD